MESTDKYELVLLSSRKLIEEIGFSALTMDKVAQKAGIAKGTLYLYFKDKNELLEKVLGRGFEIMFERIKTRAGMQANCAEKLKAIITENINYIHENRYFFKACFLDEVNIIFFKKTSQESVNSRRKRYANFIGEIIKSGIESGEFRHDLNPVKATYMLLALIKTNVIYNFFNNTNELAEEVVKNDAEEIFSLLIHGINKA